MEVDDKSFAMMICKKLAFDCLKRSLSVCLSLSLSLVITIHSSIFFFLLAGICNTIWHLLTHSHNKKYIY